MSNFNDKDLLNTIHKEILDIKNNNDLLNSKLEQLCIELNTKIDILCNFKPAMQKSITITENKKKIPSKPIFIKEKIKENKDEFLDILYTQEDYDKCVVIINSKNAKTKKSEDDKLKQVIDLLYKDVINVNPEYKAKLTKIHNDFKKHFTDLPLSETSSDTVEPKSDSDDA